MGKLIDIYGKEYVVHDIITFKEHIIKYHAVDGKPDGSIHEENGYYFKVDKEFYNKLKNL